MAKPFVLTTQLQIQIPNLNQVVSQLNKGLGNVNVPVNINIPKNANTQLTNLNKNVKNAGASARGAAKNFDSMRNSLRGALTYIAKYDAAREIFNLFAQTLRDGVSSAIAFEKEMVKVSQVTGQTMKQLRGLEREITRVSTGFGVSSGSLIKTSRVLAQTGMSARDARIALEALAKTTLAATFDDITSTTETAIAAMRQFGIASTDLEKTLGKINSLAANFAVEAGDIGVAIRRAGGAFKAAGGSLDELNALFTAVRSTTRETAETIATGFRTIFTRIQRPKTIQFLKQLGIELQNVEGQFVGPFEAVRKLNIALKSLDPKDVRYSQIIEQLGGFRQVSKVIPLIQQFGQAQKALNVSQQGGTSLARDAAKAQQSLAVQLTKVKEEYMALFREIFGGQGMQTVIKTTLKLASAFARVVDSLSPIIPLIATIGAAKLGQFALFGSLGRGRKQGGRINRFATGGMVPGKGNSDSVPAMLTPGEFVIRKSSVRTIGANRLQKMNRYGNGGTVERGQVQRVANRKASLKNKYDIGEGGIHDKYRAKLTIKTFDPNDKEVGRKAIEAEAKEAKAYGQKRYQALLKTSGDEKRSAIRAGALMRKRFGLSGFIGKRTSGQSKFFTSKTPRQSQGVTNNLVGGIHERNVSGWAKKNYKSARVGKLPDADGMDFRVGNSGVLIEAKSLKRKLNRDEIIAKGLLAKAVSKNYQDKVSQDVNLKELVYAEAPASLKKSGFTKRNRGGGISSTDTVPALLTPGEFVINRKSAAKIGYGNLNNANRFGKTPKGFAAGGIVGVQKFNNGGEARSPRLGLGVFVALQTILPQLAEAFKSADGEVTDLSMGLDAASQGLMTFATLSFATGDLLEGFGGKVKFAATGLLAVGAAAFAAYQYEKQRGMEREKRAVKNLEEGGFQSETRTAGLRRQFIDARRQQTEGAGGAAGRVAGAAGGAYAGMKAGALIGGLTPAGPVGALVGGILGAIGGGIAGYFGGGAIGEAIGKLNFDEAGAIREFNEKVKSLKLGVSIDGLTNSLKAFSEGRASIGAIASTVRSGIKSLQRGFFDVSTEEGLERFRGQLQKTLPALSEYINKAASSAKSMAEFDAIIGDEALNAFSQLSGQSIPELRRQIQENIAQRKKSAAAQKANIAAIQASNKVLYRARDAGTAFMELERRLVSFDNVMSGVEASINNTFSGLSIGKIAPNFDDITNIFDMSAFTAQVDSLSGVLGESGQSLGQDLKNFAALNSLLPNILTEAAGEIGIGGARASEIIESKLMAADPGGIIGAEFRRVIAQRVQAIAEMGEGGEGKFANRIRTDIEGVVRDLTKGMSETAEAFQKAAQFIDSANQRLAKAYNLRTQLELKQARQLYDIIGLQAENAERMSKARRQPVNADADLNTFNNQQNAILSGTAISGLGSSVTIVSNEFNRLKQRIKESDAALANLGIAADSSGDLLENNRALIDENAALKSQFEKTKQVLENYANVQARVAKVQEEIANAQARQDKAKAVAENIAFGTDQERLKIFRSFKAAEIVASRGLAALPQQFRGDARNMLSQFADAPIFGGKTGQQILDRETANLFKHFPPNIRKALMAEFADARTDEQKFLDRLDKIQQDAVKAQFAFLEGMRGDSKDLKETIAKLNATLANDLRTIFQQQENRALAREVSESKGTLANSKAQLEKLKEIRSAGIPVQDPAVLNAVRSNVAGIKALKDARQNLARFTGAQEFGINLRSQENRFTGFAAADSGRDNLKAIKVLGAQLRQQFGADVGNQLLQKAIDALAQFRVENPEATGAEIAKVIGDTISGAGLSGASSAQGIIDETMANLNAAGLGPYVDTLVNNVDMISTALAAFPSEASWSSLEESIIRTTTTINNANAAIAANSPAGAVKLASGGSIFSPHGTDTVPAMLTPGEFVVNRKAAQRNMGALSALNSGKTQYLAGGGKVGDYFGTQAVREDGKKVEDVWGSHNKAAEAIASWYKKQTSSSGAGSVFDSSRHYMAKKYADQDMAGIAKNILKSKDNGDGIPMKDPQYRAMGAGAERKSYSGKYANLPKAVKNYFQSGFLGVNGYSYGQMSGIEALDYFKYGTRMFMDGAGSGATGRNYGGQALGEYKTIGNLQKAAGKSRENQASKLYEKVVEWAEDKAFSRKTMKVGLYRFPLKKSKIEAYDDPDTNISVDGFTYPNIQPGDILENDPQLYDLFTGGSPGGRKLGVVSSGWVPVGDASEAGAGFTGGQFFPGNELEEVYKNLEGWIFNSGSQYSKFVKEYLTGNAGRTELAVVRQAFGEFDKIWGGLKPKNWKTPAGYNLANEPRANFSYIKGLVERRLSTTEKQLADSFPFNPMDIDTWGSAITSNTRPVAALQEHSQNRSDLYQKMKDFYAQFKFKNAQDPTLAFGKAFEIVQDDLKTGVKGYDANNFIRLANKNVAGQQDEKQRREEKLESVATAMKNVKGLPTGLGALSEHIAQSIKGFKAAGNFTKIPMYAKRSSASLRGVRDFWQAKDWGQGETKALYPWLSALATELSRWVSGGLVTGAGADKKGAFINLNDAEVFRQLARIQDARNQGKNIEEGVEVLKKNQLGEIIQSFEGPSLMGRIARIARNKPNAWYNVGFGDEFPYYGTFGFDSVSEAVGKLQEEVKRSFENTILIYNEQFKAGQRPFQAANKNPLLMATGGKVPQRLASGGGVFASRGTDTVPAMLTPGEFVVNKDAASKNKGALQAINSGQTQYLAGGGEVQAWKMRGFESTGGVGNKILARNWRDTAAKYYPDKELPMLSTPASIKYSGPDRNRAAMSMGHLMRLEEIAGWDILKFREYRDKILNLKLADLGVDPYEIYPKAQSGSIDHEYEGQSQKRDLPVISKTGEVRHVNALRGQAGQKLFGHLTSDPVAYLANFKRDDFYEYGATGGYTVRDANRYSSFDLRDKANPGGKYRLVGPPKGKLPSIGNIFQGMRAKDQKASGDAAALADKELIAMQQLVAARGSFYGGDRFGDIETKAFAYMNRDMDGGEFVDVLSEKALSSILAKSDISPENKEILGRKWANVHTRFKRQTKHVIRGTGMVDPENPALTKYGGGASSFESKLTQSYAKLRQLAQENSVSEAHRVKLTYGGMTPERMRGGLEGDEKAIIPLNDPNILDIIESQAGSHWRNNSLLHMTQLKNDLEKRVAGGSLGPEDLSGAQARLKQYEESMIWARYLETIRMQPGQYGKYILRDIEQLSETRAGGLDKQTFNQMQMQKERQARGRSLELTAKHSGLSGLVDYLGYAFSPFEQFEDQMLKSKVAEMRDQGYSESQIASFVGEVKKHNSIATAMTESVAANPVTKALGKVGISMEQVLGSGLQALKGFYHLSAGEERAAAIEFGAAAVSFDEGLNALEALPDWNKQHVSKVEERWKAELGLSDKEVGNRSRALMMADIASMFVVPPGLLAKAVTAPIKLGRKLTPTVVRAAIATQRTAKKTLFGAGETGAALSRGGKSGAGLPKYIGDDFATAGKLTPNQIAKAEVVTDLRGPVRPKSGVQHSANNPIRQNAIANYNRANPESMVSKFDELPAWAKRDAVNAETAARKLGEMRDSLGTFFKKMTDTDKSVVKGGVTADALSVNKRTGVATPYKKTPFQDADAMSGVVSKADADAAITKTLKDAETTGMIDDISAGIDADRAIVRKTIDDAIVRPKISQQKIVRANMEQTRIPRHGGVVEGPAGPVALDPSQAGSRFATTKADVISVGGVGDDVTRGATKTTGPHSRFDAHLQSQKKLADIRSQLKDPNLTPERMAALKRLESRYSGSIQTRSTKATDISGPTGLQGTGLSTRRNVIDRAVAREKVVNNIVESATDNTIPRATQTKFTPASTAADPATTAKTKTFAGKMNEKGRGSIRKEDLDTVEMRTKTSPDDAYIDQAAMQQQAINIQKQLQQFEATQVASTPTTAGGRSAKRAANQQASDNAAALAAKRKELYEAAGFGSEKEYRKALEKAQANSMFDTSKGNVDVRTADVQASDEAIALNRDRKRLFNIRERLQDRRSLSGEELQRLEQLESTYDKQVKYAKGLLEGKIARGERLTYTRKAKQAAEAEEMITIYRGLGDDGGEALSNWWTTDLEKAMSFTGRESGSLVSVKIPKSAVKKFDVKSLNESLQLQKQMDAGGISQDAFDALGVSKSRLEEIERIAIAAKGQKETDFGLEMFFSQDFLNQLKGSKMKRLDVADLGLGPTAKRPKMPKGAQGSMPSPEQMKEFTKLNRKVTADHFKRKETILDAAKDLFKTQGYAKGGIVSYFNSGGPAMGTDTIPAMLTPGEFVVRKAAVDSVGVETLRAINNMGKGSTSSKPKKRAGVNYLANGGQGEASGLRMPTLDVKDFNTAISKFDSSVDRLEKIFGNGIQMTHNFEDMNVIVTVNGNFGDDDGELSNGMQRRINREVRKGINDFIDRSFPDIPRMDIA